MQIEDGTSSRNVKILGSKNQEVREDEVFGLPVISILKRPSSNLTSERILSGLRELRFINAEEISSGGPSNAAYGCFCSALGNDAGTSAGSSVTRTGGVGASNCSFR